MKTKNEIHDMGADQDAKADCGGDRALSAKKCVECCRAAYRRAEQIIEPLNAVMQVISSNGWEELLNDIERFANGTSRFIPERVREKEKVAEEILKDAGFDVKPTHFEDPVEAGRVFRVRPKVRPLRRVPPPPPNEPGRTSLPVFPDVSVPELANGTATILLDPGWSLHPTPVLQQLLAGAKAKIRTRTKTKDCCDCVAKRVWGQDTKRKRQALVAGGSIMRRAPGGSKP